MLEIGRFRYRASDLATLSRWDSMANVRALRDRILHSFEWRLDPPVESRTTSR